MRDDPSKGEDGGAAFSGWGGPPPGRKEDKSYCLYHTSGSTQPCASVFGMPMFQSKYTTFFHQLFPVVSMYLAHPSGWGVNAKPPPQTGNWQNPPQPGGGNGVGAFGHGADGVGGAPPQFGGGRGGGFGGAGPGMRGGFRSASNTFDAGAQVRVSFILFFVFDGRLVS